MTVSTQVSRNEYTGNGATTQYDFTFRILDKSHLLVQTLDTSESIVTLTLGTDYTVTGVNRYNGGKVVLTSALPAGYKISIERSTPVTQEASIRNQGGFFPEIHEDALDKLTMLVQQAYGWWSGLSLRKPSWLANYYDALGNRIRNLRDPSQPQDAATKNYVSGEISSNTELWRAGDAALDKKIDDRFSRTLRVVESSIPELPPINRLEGKLLAISGGRPVGVLPESGSASDVMIELAKNDGFTKIGNFFGGEGSEGVGDANQSVWERIFKRGQFEIHQMPGDPAGVAGIVFGGPDNKAAVVVDERGRIQTYAIVDGKLSAAQISTPIVQGTGYFNNGFEDKIVRFPSAGNESDDLSPGLLITTNANGIIDIFVVSPNQFNDLGYPTGSSLDKQMFKLVKSFDIGTSLQRTIDQCPTVENSSTVLYHLFDVNYSGFGSKVVSGILSVGNYVDYTSNVYLVTLNPQNLSAAPSLGADNIYQWLKVTALHGGQSGWGDSALTPAVGLVNDPNNTMAKIFLRLPAYGQRISFTPINVAKPSVVTFYYNDLRNNVTVDTPNYLVYSFAEKMATDRFYVKMNNGDVRYSPGTVVRVSGNVTDRLSDKLSDGVFAVGGTYHLANKGRASGITVTNPSTGQYVISGCNLRGDHWKVCPPVGFSGTSFGTPPYIVNIVSQGTNTFTIEVKTAAGSLVNINGFDWLDLHVQPA
ncbi:Phage T7 tail fibre protein [Klebsiella quasipneumoniae]|uniref:phage tail fiber domain-containing protein n=1 Tax=Klebsiella quasipneumoniae TaxID=1463165 RepID=UPI000808FF8F|nr:phage tail fiber protein [Klebsiella quasipneumoniae]SBZ07932.1 Phage T7 tail fibre protein [Klebsiella quasipneumoniae]